MIGLINGLLESFIIFFVLFGLYSLIAFSFYGLYEKEDKFLFNLYQIFFGEKENLYKLLLFYGSITVFCFSMSFLLQQVLIKEETCLSKYEQKVQITEEDKCFDFYKKELEKIEFKEGRVEFFSKGNNLLSEYHLLDEKYIDSNYREEVTLEDLDQLQKSLER